MNHIITRSYFSTLLIATVATTPLLNMSAAAAEKRSKSKTATAVQTTKKASPQPDKKYQSLKAEFAAKCPRFAAAWEKAIASGSPDDFLALAKHKENKQVIQIGGSHSFSDHFMTAFSVFASAGLSPHFAAAPHDESDAVLEVAAGGTIRFPLVGVFSTPIQPTSAFPSFAPAKGEKCELRDFAVSPAFPFGANEESQAWFRIKDENLGNLTVRFTVQIPADAPLGEQKLTVSALAVGPKEGLFSREKVEKTFAIHIVPTPAWSREGLLCLWQTGVEAGHSLTESPGMNDSARKATQATIAALRERIEKIAAEPGYALKDFARTLLDHPAFPKSETTAN